MSVHAVMTKDCNPRYLKLAGFWLLMAYSVWIVDRNYCPELRSVRYGLPRNIQFLLQFHAWWHIFSNLGCAFCILFMYDMRSRYLRHKTKSKLKWGLFPYMEVDVTQKDMP
ncbi:alkaline ceramidase 3-like [Amphiura filiformis]|uniref:alkaline ceramidase 3-like n=1 Tax=Amphiura filiformis TaxID=82378 RepID=UPI003B218C05